MSDPKDLDLGDLDWDAALDQWEKTSFSPEVAKDAPAAAAATAVPDELAATGAMPSAAATLPGTPSGGAFPTSERSLTAATGHGTVIAPVPAELRSDPPPPEASPAPVTKTSAPPSALGTTRPSAPPPNRTSAGLGQLFSKSPSVPPPPAPARLPRLPGFDPGSEKTRVASAEQLDELAVNSAWPSGSDPAIPAAPIAPMAPIAPPPRLPRVNDEDEETAIHRSVRPETTRVFGDAHDAPPLEETRRFDSISDAETANRLPDADLDAPQRPTVTPSTTVTTPRRDATPRRPERATFQSERPGSRWLDAATAEAYRVRATWLEEEARALGEPTDMARALLTVSELYALVGETEQALVLALEARDLAPALHLAWRQSRQLGPRDEDSLVAALDAEAQSSPTPAARAHATLVAADVARTAGMGDGAIERWKSACLLDPADVRPHVALAAVALAQDTYASKAFDLADNSELEPLHRAVLTALRMRDHERPEEGAAAFPVSDGLRRARTALAAQDGVAAAQALTTIATEPTLAKPALWLASAFGAPLIAGRRASARALRTLANDGDDLARRELAARGVELADPELVEAALGAGSAFDASEKVVLATLAGLPVGPLLGEVEGQAELAPLLDAASVVAKDGDDPIARAGRVAGLAATRVLARTGRLLAARASARDVDAALGSLEGARPPTAAGVALDLALRERRFDEIAAALSALPASGDAAWQRHVAAALLSDRAGNRADAARAWKEALAEGARHDVAARAAATGGEDLAPALLALAEEMGEGTTPAVLRLEALTRTPGMAEDEALSLLERVHRAAPQMGLGSFLAERIARRKGDLDETLRWIHERAASATEDPFDAALDAVREALLVAERDPERAATRLEQAHQARPADVALRELYERLATEPPPDRAAWREARAATATGAAKAVLLTEAALEHERAGDLEAAVRTARLAEESGDVGLAGLVAERAELELGRTTAALDELRTLAANAEADAAQRIGARERLAEVEVVGRKDREAALALHRLILEETPHHRPSLRFVEQELVTQGNDVELARVAEEIGLALDGTMGGEVTAHAQVAARIRSREEGWERTGNMARLAATQPEPSLWSIRALNAHARGQRDDAGELSTTLTLLERTQRPAERAALLLRASEACARMERVEEARQYLEQAATEDPGDVVTWGFLAEIRSRAGEAKGAAEACESLARTSAVREHQLLAWYDAARIWIEEAKDPEHAMSALEQAAEIDVGYADVFTRLSGLYAERRLDAELARLLEKRLESALDDNERVVLEVELARTLAEMGELGRAKDSLERALANQPDHTTALGALAEVCAKEGDWASAEQAYVRLARLSPDPKDQRAIYEKLAEIYSVHAPNLSRAEVALKEVLKRAPGDVAVMEKLVDLYKRQGDVPRAVETQQQIVAESTAPEERLRRQIELAAIHEGARDLRKAEQALEAGRKEFPTSVVALRALAEFYGRQRQMPAMQILLDRAASDARRSFAAGRFVPALFEVLHAAYELRGKKDAAKVVAATLAAVEGQPARLAGADARAVDPQLDDVLAPELVSPSLRLVLASAGDALDAVSPLDLRALRAQPLGPGPLAQAVGAVATAVGLAMLQVYVSPALGRVAIPLSSNPPALLVGEALGEPGDDRARAFLVVRAVKMILSRSSALLRAKPEDAAVLVNALFTAFNPTYAPQGGVDERKVAELAGRIQHVLPRNMDPTVGVIALEAAGMLGTQSSAIGQAATGWANRVALLAVGDPGAALDAIAWSQGQPAAPTGSEERGSWVARTAEARELMTFSVTDSYSEARSRFGLG